MDTPPSEPPLAVYLLPPVWGSPSPSPFAIKLLTWLRMAKVPHVARPPDGPPRSATGKIPYVVMPDGRMLHDSGLTIATIARERGIDLDRDLDPVARATGHVVRRMLEEHTYWVGVHDRWVPDANAAISGRDYFRHVPALLRGLLPWVVRRRMLGYLHAQGVGRHPPETIAELARADFDALAAILGDREHVLGPLSSIDATVTAFLWSLTCHPFPSIGADAMRRHPNLVAYLERMRRTWWPDYTDGPADGGSR